MKFATDPPRLVVGIAQEAGAIYGVRLLELLREGAVETHLVMCECSSTALVAQTGRDIEGVRSLADHVYHPTNQAARISSGSFLTEGMVLAPCSPASLGAIANGLATNLFHRAADVTMKEGRPLLLLFEAAPMSPICNENLQRLSSVPEVEILRVERLSEVQGDRRALDRIIFGLLSHFGLECAGGGETAARGDGSSVESGS